MAQPYAAACGAARPSNAANFGATVDLSFSLPLLSCNPTPLAGCNLLLEKQEQEKQDPEPIDHLPVGQNDAGNRGTRHMPQRAKCDRDQNRDTGQNVDRVRCREYVEKAA